MELKELKTELESKLKDAKDPKEIESLTARVQSIQSAEDLISRQAEKIKELLLATPGKNQDNPPAPGDEPPFVPKTFAELADEIMKGKK